MGKFRKKPIIIEAEQWFPGYYVEGVDYDPGQINPAYIDTLEGRMVVSRGDWIITGINGEKYPCKPDIFEKTYDKISEN